MGKAVASVPLDWFWVNGYDPEPLPFVGPPRSPLRRGGWRVEGHNGWKEVPPLFDPLLPWKLEQLEEAKATGSVPDKLGWARGLPKVKKGKKR